MFNPPFALLIEMPLIVTPSPHRQCSSVRLTNSNWYHSTLVRLTEHRALYGNGKS